VKQDLGPGFQAKVSISDSVVSNNTSGIVNQADDGFARVSISGVRISNNAAFGINNRAIGATANATVSVGASTISLNAVGFNNESGVGGVATFESLGDNHLRQNDTATTGTITLVSGG